VASGLRRGAPRYGHPREGFETADHVAGHPRE